MLNLAHIKNNGLSEREKKGKFNVSSSLKRVKRSALIIDAMNFELCELRIMSMPLTKSNFYPFNKFMSYISRLNAFQRQKECERESV